MSRFAMLALGFSVLLRTIPGTASEGISGTLETVDVENHVLNIRKRQVSSNIRMQQQDYRFAVTKCGPGSLVGKVVAADHRGAAIYYLLDRPSDVVGINQRTGQLFLINLISPNREYFSVVRATGISGSASANVTFGCGAFSSVAAPPPPPEQSSYFFTTKTCIPGSLVGTLTSRSQSCRYTPTSLSPNYVFFPDGGIRLTNPTTATKTVQVRVECGQSNRVIAVSITSSCPVFPAFSKLVYAFTTNTCGAGQTVGTVTASNAVVYVIEPPHPLFTVSPVSGQIMTTGSLTGSSYAFPVRAYSSTRSTTGVVVSISAPKCHASHSETQPAFKFFSDDYTFSLNNCTASAFVGQIGTFGGSTGASTSFSIENPTGAYVIGASTGAISAVGIPKSTTLTVRAMNGKFSITVSVEINVRPCQTIMVSHGNVRPISSGGGPVFGQRSYAMSAASCAADTAAGQVFASDGSDNNIKYSIDTDLSGNDLKIDSHTGVIYLNGPLRNLRAKALVLATDSSGKQSMANLIVKCADSTATMPLNNVGNRLGFTDNGTTLPSPASLADTEFVPPGADFR